MKMFLLGMLVMYLGTFIITLLVGFFTRICEDDFLEHIFMFPLLIIFWIIKIIVVPFLKILDNFKKWWYNNYRKTEREVIIMLDKILAFEDNVEKERIKLVKIYAEELGQDISEWEREDYLGYYALLLLKAKKFHKRVDK